jgi:hypothetical protein
MSAATDNEFLKRFQEIEAQYEKGHEEYSEPGIRTKYVADIEHRVWTLWGYVRDNKNSLDSERACKMIRAGIDVAVGDNLTQMEKMSKAIEQLKTELDEVKQKLDEAKKASKPKKVKATEEAK